MNGTQAQQRVQTLGERLSGLGPGDPCPCCGAPMEALRVPGAVRRLGTAAETERPVMQTLACPECGCEVGPEEGPFAAHACQGLSVAA